MERSPTSASAACVMVLLAVALCAEARGGHWFHQHSGTPPPGQPRAIEHTHCRAGFPLCVSSHAEPSNTPAYEGYYVGGGSAHHGDARCREEGTWGWDYVGLRLPRNVSLGWNHGRLSQGGTGSYATDGRPIPDVIGLTASGLRLHGSGGASEP